MALFGSWSWLWIGATGTRFARRVPGNGNLGLVYEAVTAKKWWLIGPPLAALVLVGGSAFLQPPRYSAEAQVLIGPRTAGLIGLRSSLALFGGTSSSGPAAGQAQLIASRDLARRAIKDLRHRRQPRIRSSDAEPWSRLPRAHLSWHAARSGSKKPGGPRSRSLSGPLASQRAGQGKPRHNYISVRRPGACRQSRQSHCGTLSRNARRRECAARNGDARIVSRAIMPVRQVFQRRPCCSCRAPRCLSWRSARFVSIAAAGRRLPGRPEAPVEQPRALEQVRVFARLKQAAKSQSGAGQGIALRILGGPDKMRSGQWASHGKNHGSHPIGALRGPGVRGIRRGKRIVATSLGSAAAASGMMRDFARDLAREGRSIVIGLDESSLFDFGELAAGAPHGGALADGVEPGLCDLLERDGLVRRSHSPRSGLAASFSAGWARRRTKSSRIHACARCLGRDL